VKLSRLLIIGIVVVVVIAVVLILFMVLQAPGPPCTPKWNCGAPYPLQVSGSAAIAGEQCFVNSTAIVCVGGQDANGGPRNEIYSGGLSASGNVTGWTLEGSSYPRVINGQSCVLSGGFVYCVGGIYDANQDDTSSAYYAPMGPSGVVGGWDSTTAFPIPVDSQSCVASASYIYCIGGYNETDGTAADSATSSSVWYAQLSASGIGQWTKTTPYPTNFFLPSCVTVGGYVYCMGGIDVNGNSVGAAYYAALSSTGVGAWRSTASYPLPASGLACVISSGTIYCVGGVTVGGQNPTFTGAVYYAQALSTGISTWKSGPDYPTAVSTDCVASSSVVYCIGGFDGNTGENSAVKYAAFSSLQG
jgi:hypothetical protein